jgi:hypothetical protein
MTAEFFRRIAQQCRMLMARAQTNAVREQLRIWAEEFEAQSEAVEPEEERHRSHSHR